MVALLRPLPPSPPRGRTIRGALLRCGVGGEVVVFLAAGVDKTGDGRGRGRQGLDWGMPSTPGGRATDAIEFTSLRGRAALQIPRYIWYTD